MSPVEIGSIMLAALLVLMALGVHIAVALIVLSFCGIWWIRADAVIATKLLSLTASDALANYLFGMVPMFILMGLVVDRSRIGRDTFDAAQWLLGRLPGGLGVATVSANAVFAAITGISIASAALFTRVAVPQMLRLGYQPRFAVGAVAGSSVLGMLIPPSLLLILYGIISESSIGSLFRAGIAPGIMLAVAFCTLIVLTALFFPGRIMTDGKFTVAASADTGLTAALKMLPSAMLIGTVLGGIYGGVFTVTEAAAAGAASALLISFLLRRITLRDVWEVLIETGHITVTILFLILAANIYGKMLAFSRIPQELLGFINELGIGFLVFLLLYILLLILLGMILDSISILLIVVPIVLPVATGFGADLIWFGIITVIAVEIGLLTPPFGLSVYVVKATLAEPGITLGDVFRGAFPFVLIMLVILAILVALPGTALIFV